MNPTEDIVISVDDSLEVRRMYYSIIDQRWRLHHGAQPPRPPAPSMGPQPLPPCKALARSVQ